MKAQRVGGRGTKTPFTTRFTGVVIRVVSRGTGNYIMTSGARGGKKSAFYRFLTPFQTGFYVIVVPRACVILCRSFSPLLFLRGNSASLRVFLRLRRRKGERGRKPAFHVTWRENPLSLSLDLGGGWRASPGSESWSGPLSAPSAPPTLEPRWAGQLGGGGFVQLEG